MADVIEVIIKDFKEKKDKIFQLSNLCGEHENNIAKKLFKTLGWNNLNQKEYDGLFGWEKFKADKCRKFNEQLLIIEVKKVTEKSEYGYWHALTQGMIYSFLQHKENKVRNKNYLVLCIVLDWGRKAGQKLDNDEKSFIDKFKTYKISFIRISMVGDSKFIEHNLYNGWSIINEND